MQSTSTIQLSHKRWLIACMLCVALMVFIGGVTRLTESGLSIVEWKLVSGTLPPLSDAAWEQEFSEYKQSPEYIKKNAHFELSEFKNIFWLEYIHRLMGRITGLVFFLPLMWFFIKKSAPPRFLKRMFFISLLVATQGAVGWIMVASGLVDQPRVSPIKLAMHLSLAFSVFGLLVYSYMQFTGARGFATPDRKLFYGARILLGLFACQLVLGAIVAGTDAGLSYNTYPLMDGKFVPDGLFILSPTWLNMLENITMVQWQHRIMALILVKAALVLSWYVLRYHRDGASWAIWLIIIILAQFTLGIAALLSALALPLASMHQMMALALLAIVTRLVQASSHPAHAKG